MKIVYYTSGTSGIGRLVHGAAIYNALARKGTGAEYIILSSAPPERAGILDALNISHIELPVENQDRLLNGKYTESALFNNLTRLNPDLLIVDRMWFTLQPFIRELPCKKIFICSQVIDRFFVIYPGGEEYSFIPDYYHRLIASEPFESIIPMEQVNPLIIRNRDEILSRDDALKGLGLSGEKKTVFVGVNFKPGYLDDFRRKYSYLEDEGYDVIYSTNMEGEGIFPVADYYNAIDLMICSATYNFFWESRFFDKEAFFETVPVKFCDQEMRLNEYGDYSFDVNGADQLAEIVLSL